MSLEMELKLALPANKVEALLALPLFTEVARPAGQVWLENYYYDTPELSLSQRRMALRIRRTDKGLLQTLKTSGTSVEGLHQRSEWEWPIANNELDLKGLAERPWPADIDAGQLAVVFSTDFTRQLWYLEQPELGLCVEIAMDRGDIHCPSSEARLAICELELELLEGSAEQLLALGEQLCEQLPELQRSDLSKAARGYSLFKAQ